MATYSISFSCKVVNIGGWGTMYKKHVVPVGRLIQEKDSSLDKILTLIVPIGVAQFLGYHPAK